MRFEYFLFNKFFKKKNNISKITAKNYFWGITIFEGTVRSTPKMNVTFSVGKGVPNTVFKFFPKKKPYHLNLTQKTTFGGTFSPISVVLLGRLFLKTIGFTHWWTRTNHVIFMKIGSKLRPESCVLILHTYIILPRYLIIKTSSYHSRIGWISTGTGVL